MSVQLSTDRNLHSVQWLSRVWLFVTPWTVANQASLSITNSPILLKLMSIESVIPSNHLICCPLLSCLQSLPAPGSFTMSQLFTSGGQSVGASVSASVLLMNIQSFQWFPLGLIGSISLQSINMANYNDVSFDHILKVVFEKKFFLIKKKLGVILFTIVLLYQYAWIRLVCMLFLGGII